METFFFFELAAEAQCRLSKQGIAIQNATWPLPFFFLLIHIVTHFTHIYHWAGNDVLLNIFCIGYRVECRLSNQIMLFKTQRCPKNYYLKKPTKPYIISINVLQMSGAHLYSVKMTSLLTFFLVWLQQDLWVECRPSKQ